MQATERPAARLARDEERIGGMQATHHELDIVLKPLSRPELGEIRIDGSMFAVGRTEPPFVGALSSSRRPAANMVPPRRTPATSAAMSD